MKNKPWSKLTWLILGLLPFLFVACGGGAASPTAVPATDEPMPATAIPTEEVIEAEAVDEPEEMEEETAVSDEVMPVSAKPQLIEFYADW